MNQEILNGVKVLDISTVLAAPMATAFLGEFGAEVIKVESKNGDPARSLWPKKDEISLLNKTLSRNKKNITLDLHYEEATNLIYRLVEWADVIVTNFMPETLRKFKIDYSDILKVKPDIIYLNLTAFGRTGTYADRSGYARMAEAYAGLTYVTGYPDRPPVFAGAWMVDGICSIHAAYSIMLALYHKERTGEGQLIDLALYEPLFRVMEDFTLDFSVNGNVKQRTGNLNPGGAPSNIYITSDDIPVVITAMFNKEFKQLCMAMDRADLIQKAEFATPKIRMVNRTEIDSIVRDWVKTKTKDELFELLKVNNVTYGPVNSIKDIFDDPHMWDRESLVNVYDEELGQTITVQNVIPKMSKTPGAIKWNGGEIGSHNDEIYLDVLELPTQEYSLLKEKGVI